jgi:hypothetical protein
MVSTAIIDPSYWYVCVADWVLQATSLTCKEQFELLQLAACVTHEFTTGHWPTVLLEKLCCIQRASAFALSSDISSCHSER